MATEVVVPPVGESISSVTVLSWLKAVGDDVKMGDVLAELETDKSTVDLECPARGVLLARTVDEGETVAVGTTLAVVGSPNEQWSPGASSPDAEADPASSATPGARRSDSETHEATGTRGAPPRRPSEADRSGARADVRAAPSARRLASELGVDLAAVAAGLGGRRVTTDDVRRFDGARPATAPGPASTEHGAIVQLSRIRRAVAGRMAESARTIPQFSVSVDIDVSRLVAAREALGRSNAGKAPSVSAFLVWAVGRALAEHGALNAVYAGEGVLETRTSVNIAVAVATEDGLVAPVLRDADRLPIAEIGATLADLVDRARNGRLGPDEMTGATFTLSNLGPLGAKAFVPMVVPGQTAILGTGAIRRVPVVADDGSIGVVSVVSATLAADHRVTDGAGAMAFLRAVKHALESSVSELV